MPWVEIFTLFVVSHLIGDYILQTEFQATNKHGGLGRDPVSRRALLEHTLCYTASYIPALVWIGVEESSVLTAVVAALLIGVPHGLQDDGRAMRWWMRAVKHTAPTKGTLAMLVDQSFHVVALLLLAIAIGA